MSKKKKAVIISLLIIVSVAIAIVAITSFAFTSYFQPKSDQPPMPDVAEKNDLTANDNTSSQTASSSSSSIIPTTIDIASTTSAFPFVQRWAAEYENQQLASSGNVDVEYLTDREIKEAKAEDSDLAIVGIPDENGASYIPLSPQAVSIVYNIPSFPDIPSGLRLNSTTLFLILNGSITQWNDAAIKDLNPSLNLPDEKIIVVHNSDDNNNSSSSNSSSSMLLLNQYLGFQDIIINWPNDSVGASGPAELAETVRKTPYSLGYVDFSYAVQTKMTYAAIGNADGDYIVPSTQSIGQAVNLALQFHNSSTNGSLSSQQQQQQQPPTLNASRLVNGSYPIVGLYYGSLLPNHDEEERKASILDFVEWLISDEGGQQTLLEVQYPPIYSSNNSQLATYAKTTMDTIIPN